MIRRRARAALGLAVLPAACCNIDPVALETWVHAQADRPAFVRAQGEVRIESPNWSGDFTAVLLVRREPLAVRLQMFPDIGGKALDLAASLTTQRGVMPPTGAVHNLPGGRDDRLLGMFATSLLALYGADLSHLRCFTTAAERTEFTLARRGVSWRVVQHDDQRFEVLGKRFRMTIDVTDKAHPRTLDAELFELALR